MRLFGNFRNIAHILALISLSANCIYIVTSASTYGHYVHDRLSVVSKAVVNKKTIWHYPSGVQKKQDIAE